MKTGAIIGIILVILIIMGVVIFGFFSCSIKNSLGFGLNCHISKAISENDVSICKELSKPFQISSCYKSYALEKKDANVCNDIPNKLDIGSCYYFLTNEQSNTILICQNLPEGVEKPNCQTAFIRTRVDTSQEISCDNLETLRDKNFCYLVTAIAKNDPNVCENIDTSEFATEIDDCKENVEEQNSYT